MSRVLVTRPEPGASQTARRLEALGFSPVLLPLFETRGLFVDRDAVPKNPGLVAVTSANAIRHAPPELRKALARAPCFAVGQKTAEAARAAGFFHVIEGPGDAEGLAQAIIASGSGGPVAYLCGRARRPAFEELLASASIPVKTVEVYKACKVSYLTDFALSILGGETVDAALVYSARTAEALLDIVGRPCFAELFANMEFFCLSARIAEVLESRVSGRIRVAAEPSEEALLSLLGEPD